MICGQGTTVRAAQPPPSWRPCPERPVAVVARCRPRFRHGVPSEARAARPPNTASGGSSRLTCATAACLASGAALRSQQRRGRCSANPPDVLEKVVSSANAPGEEVDIPEERWLMIFLVAAAYVVWTMCKVNMSVAILPMAQQYGWDPPTVGVIQGALFWGYAFSQIPGGFLATRYGGKRVLLGAVVFWSFMTAVAPWAASMSTEALIVSRVLVGLGEGLAPPAGARIIATWIPETERSRAVAIFGSGSKAGNILALLVAPQVITAYGWPAVFFSFGLLGLLWGAVWAVLGKDRDPCGPEACQVELPEIPAAVDDAPVPWQRILSSPAVWGILGAHFGNNWGMFGLLTWLPSYLNKELGFDLQGSSLLTLVPSVFGIICAGLAGSLADQLRSEGWTLTDVRKVSQAVAFVVPAVALGLLGLPNANEYGATASIALLIAAVGASSFSYAGLYSSHIDLNAKYAGLVNGLSTTVGAIAGTLSNMYCGNMLASTSWAQALFIPSVTCYVFGLVMYLALYNATPLDWDAEEERANGTDFPTES